MLKRVRIFLFAVVCLYTHKVMAQSEDCEELQQKQWSSVEEACETLNFVLSKIKSPSNPFKACPQGKRMLNRLLNYLVQSGEFGKAISLCEVYENELGLFGDAALACAESYLRRGDLEQGGRLAKMYARYDFDKALESAELFEKLGFFGEAANVLKDFTVDLFDPSITLRIIRNYLRAGQPEDALRHVESAKQELKKSGKYRDVVLLFLTYGYRDKAKAICGAMLSGEGLTTGELDAILAVAKALEEKHLVERVVNRVQVYEDWERCKIVVDMLDKYGFYNAEVQTLERCKGENGERLLRLGLLHGKLGNSQVARDFLIKAGKSGGNLATMAGVGLIDFGYMEEAEKVLKDYGDMANVDTVLALGRAVRRKGKAEEWQVYEGGASFADDKNAYWRRVGKDLLDQREIELAERAFRQATEENATNEAKAYAYVELAETIMSSKSKRLSEARDALAKAILLGGANERIAERVERLATSWGIYDHLRLVIAEAKAKNDPMNYEAFLELGESYLAMGKKAEGVDALNKAIGLSKRKEQTFEKALSLLLNMSSAAEAISLAYSHQNLWENVSARIAYNMGITCLEKGDITCATKFFSVYLNAGVEDETDYLDLAEKFAQGRMWSLLEKALLLAKKQLDPQDQWRIPYTEGKVAVIRRDLGAAYRYFEDAINRHPNPPALMNSISSFCEEQGRLRMALEFAWKSINARKHMDVVPDLVRVMHMAHRLGDIDLLKKAFSAVNPSKVRTLEQLRLMVSFLMNAGLTKDAKALATAVLPSLEEAERLGGRDLLMLLDVMEGDLSALMEKAASACMGIGRNEELCLSAVQRLDSVAMPMKALEVLQKACKEGCPVSLYVEMAHIALKVGNMGLFEASIKVACENVPKPEDVIDRVGTLLMEATRYAEYERVLRLLATRPGFQNNRALSLELARVILAQGRVAEAKEILRRYSQSGKGRIGDCYRVLATEGYRDEAIELLFLAKPVDIAAMPYGDLRVIYLDLLRSGKKQEAKVLLEMFRKGNEEISAVNETLGQLAEEAQNYDSALEYFDLVEGGRVSLDGRRAWVEALWAKGRREQAVEVAKGALSVLDEKHTCDDRQEAVLIELVRFFINEAACDEALEVWSAFKQSHRMSTELALELASALVYGGKTEQARAVFKDVALDLDRLNKKLLSYVVAETHEGTVESLGDFLDTIPETKPIAGAKVLAACLQGDEKRLSALLTKYGERADPTMLFYLGKALFWCGRWEKAYRFTMKALQTGDLGILKPEVARLAVRSGLAGGVKRGKEEVLALLSRVVEDRPLFLRLASAVEKASGNYEGYAARLREAWREDRGSGSAGERAIKASFLSGDEALASDLIDEMFSIGARTRMVVETVSDLARIHIREGVMAKKTDILKSIYPGDARLLFLDFEMKVRAGLEKEALMSAEEYVESCQHKDLCYARVASVAAENMGLTVVRWALSRITHKKQHMEVATAMMKGAFALWKAGEKEKAKELFRRGAVIAPDKAEYFVTAASTVLSDVNLDEALLEDAKDTDVPLVKAVRCFKGNHSDISSCVASTRDYFPTTILLQGAHRAMVLERYGIAQKLLEQALALDRSLSIRLYMASAVATTIWPPSGDAKTLAKFAMEVIRETRGFYRFGSLIAFLADVAQRKGAGVKFYEERIRAMPADAETRNNFAYYLSVGGIDLPRSIREVRLSEVLGSRGHGFYFETEAWALYLQGKVESARRLQLKARALWRIDQGGGLAESFYHLGQILEASKDSKGAKEAYRRAFVLEPSERAAKHALERFLKIQ